MTITTSYQTKTKRTFRLKRVIVRPISADENDQWTGLMEKYHPLGSPKLPGFQQKYVAEHCGKAVALLSFSACAYQLADRDCWIGWSREQLLMRKNLIVQNSRFLILSDEKHQNMASKILTLATKRLSDDWQDCFNFRPVLVETFVDPGKHQGTCYQAAGWECIGQTRGFRRDSQDFYTKDSTTKLIWMKPLVDNFREILCAEQLPDGLSEIETDLPKKHIVDAIGTNKMRSLFQALMGVHDPRGGQGKRYSPASCLSIVICGMLAGCTSLRACALLASELNQRQLAALRIWKHPKTGKYIPPKHCTLWRILNGTDPVELEQIIEEWLRGVELPEAIAIDGKVLRATLNNEDGGSCSVSAVSHSGSPFF